MAHEFNHVHLKAPDPEKTANWYVQAFDFTIVGDAVRPSGDRFIRCDTKDGIRFNISGARTDEVMGQGDASAHYGVEHFGISVDDIEAEIERLKGFGAELIEGPSGAPGAPTRIAFIKGPDDTRIEILQILPK